MGSAETEDGLLNQKAKRLQFAVMFKNLGRRVMANKKIDLLVFIVLVVVAVISFGTYKIGYNKAYRVEEQQQAKIANLTSQLNQLQTKISSGDYLAIRQWGVKLPLATPISDATYSLVNNSWDGHQTAFLSTATMDNSPVCQQFFASDAAHPTFEWITRYSPSDMFKPAEAGGSSVSAASAVQQWPKNYRLVNGYVYAFGQSTGSSCPEESIAMQEAYVQAFKSF